MPLPTAPEAPGPPEIPVVLLGSLDGRGGGSGTLGLVPASQQGRVWGDRGLLSVGGGGSCDEGTGSVWQVGGGGQAAVMAVVLFGALSQFVQGRRSDGWGGLKSDL